MVRVERAQKHISSRRGRGNVGIPKGFPKSVGRVGSRLLGFPCFPHSVISMACFSPGRRWVYCYIDQAMGRTRKEVFVVAVVDECFGDLALIETTTDDKRVSMSRSLVSRVCSLFFPSSGFCFCCCSWFRCSPPGFYSHSG